LNETQHKRQQNIVANYIYTRGSQTRGPPVFCAASGAFWEFSNNYHSSYFVYSSMFKSARPASEQLPFKRT